ncbi:hypothetical protein HYT55_05960 [Candidatus Woesearchaeota archaeon]|nr:hypothetical protein [Candidatus Woesearchaeota archaeon]
MDLHIFGWGEVFAFQPTKSTYAIRIASSKNYPLDQKPLVDSTLYTRIVKYTFDDIEPGMGIDGLRFTRTLAEQILRDFQQHKDSIEALLVHCAFGENRSPAVAIALNEIFALGHETSVLKERYPELNKFVYRTLLETAKQDLSTFSQ